jgi:hypothetical protein
MLDWKLLQIALKSMLRSELRSLRLAKTAVLEKAE